MGITRRSALKNLGIITGGLLLLPGCDHKAAPPSIILKKLKITGDQEALLTEVVDTILPVGQLPGAKALNVQQFVLKMVDDCQTAENQKKFEEGFARLDDKAKEQFSKTFSNLYTTQRQALLTSIEENGDKKTLVNGKETELGTFVAMTKRYTIQGYLQSEYVMTNVLVYNMIPGRFDGCIKIDKEKQKTITA